MEFVAEKTGNTWTGEAMIPLDYFPPNVTMMNAYAIHGSGERRQYEALYPATKDFKEPDLYVLCNLLLLVIVLLCAAIKPEYLPYKIEKRVQLGILVVLGRV